MDLKDISNEKGGKNMCEYVRNALEDFCFKFRLNRLMEFVQVLSIFESLRQD